MTRPVSAERHHQNASLVRMRCRGAPASRLWYTSDRASSAWCNIITHRSDKGRGPPMEPPHWTAHADRAIKSYRWAKAFARINMLLSFALLVYLLLETLFLSQSTALRAFNLLLAFLAGFYFSWSLLFAVYIIPRDQAMLTAFIKSRRPD